MNRLMSNPAAVRVIAPTIIVVVTSFTNGFSLKFPPAGYSARWYEALWSQSPEILDAAWISLKVALLATTVNVVVWDTLPETGLVVRPEAKPPVQL